MPFFAARIERIFRFVLFQGAVMSLRVLAQGIAGPIYGHIFYVGVSGVVRDKLGATIPGLPLFLSSAVSFTAAMVSGCPAFPRFRIKV